jgi:hypothetical protein
MANVVNGIQLQNVQANANPTTALNDHRHAALAAVDTASFSFVV